MRPLFLLLVLALASCGEPASRHVSYVPPETPGGRLCTTQCGQARDYCRESCDLHQRQCATKVQSQALIDYQNYMAEQYIHSGAVELRARDFERMTPCNDNYKVCRADCDEDYQGCYKTCGGGVGVTTSCQFLCF